MLEGLRPHVTNCIVLPRDGVSEGRKGRGEEGEEGGGGGGRGMSGGPCLPVAGSGAGFKVLTDALSVPHQAPHPG